MSTLFGILNKNGEPIQHEWLDRMAVKTQLPNCQPTRTWGDGCFGFGITQRYETPQDHLTAQPLNDSTSGIHIIATGRLDYRDDLARKLGFDVSQLDITADIVLMQLAWRKWQRDCALHLEGDWSIAVWDARARTLDLLRDSVGITALHYVDNVKHFAFSTRIDALLELPWVSRKPNIERLVEVLAICQGDGTTTAYRDVRRLSPASRLHIGVDSTMAVEDYRDPLAANSTASNNEDHFEQFVCVFEDAVKTRMRSVGPTGITLSSGLDSSSVALASNRIAQQTGARIAVFSATPMDATIEIHGRLADEAPIVRNTCRTLKQLDVYFSDASDVTPTHGMFEALSACCEPSHAVVNHFWIVSLLRQARQSGMATILTGQLGNATVSWLGADRRALHDFLLGDFRSAWLRWHRQQTQVSTWRAIRSEIISPALSRLRAAVLPYRTAHQWIAQAYLVSSVDVIDKVRRRLIAQRRDALEDPRNFAIKATCRQANPIWAALSAWTGVSVRDPTCDERLIKLCLTLPDNQFQSPAEQKMLAKRYLRTGGLFAAANSRLKGLQSADVIQRLKQERESVEQLLQNLAQRTDVALVDISALMEGWSGVVGSPNSSMDSHTKAGAWLRALSVACSVTF